MALLRSSPAPTLPCYNPLSATQATKRAAAVAATRKRLRCVSLFGFRSKSPKPDIVQAGDPILHEPAREVTPSQVTDYIVQKTIQDLVQTMRGAPAVGLAAPQIGIPLQIIALEDTDEYISYISREEALSQQRKAFDLLVIINPVLKPTSSAKARFFEGCLSVDRFRALVERHLDVEVTGLDREGKPLTVEASGWQARILQHECDHLAGTLYVDKFIPRTFRSTKNLSMPMARGCPRPGLCSVDHLSPAV